MINTILLDRRNYETELPRIVKAVAACQFCGLDVETQDDARHAGLNLFMKVNEDTRKRAGNKKLVFDHRRTVMTGFSVYPEGCDRAWYINLAHADVENRLTWDEVKRILDARPANGFWLSHNAPFELVMFAACHGLDLDNVICTMQLSVTAFGDDVYDIDLFKTQGLNHMDHWPMAMMCAAQKGGVEREMVWQLTSEARADLKVLGLRSMPDDLRSAYLEAMKVAHPDKGGAPGKAELVNAAYERLKGDNWEEVEDEESSRRRFNRDVDEIIGKICTKEADSSACYNGYVYDLAYGHGLKQLVQRIFGHQMGTFRETIGDNAHMGQLTGEQVREYGAEDAYWVVPLFRWLLDYVARTSPNALDTFFTQENPMIYVYADLWRGGMRVNLPAIEARRVAERAEYANLLRSLRAALRGCKTFPEQPNPELVKRQPWYVSGYSRYRAKIQKFMDYEDVDDDFEEVCRVKGAVSTAWIGERGGVTDDFSVMHYMPVRTMMYDLLGGKLQFKMGKLTSDGEARGRLKIWLEENDPDPCKLQVMDCLAAMAGVETRMKLYLTPYVHLTDPETGKLYPTVNSLLNTRRLGASTPNPMQLAKRGESTYVRGFFEGDAVAA